MRVGRPLLASALLLPLAAGCGSEPRGGYQPPTTEQIERLSTPGEEPAAVAGPQLAPIAREDVERELAPGAGCEFRRGDDLLLVAVADDAIVRRGGRIVHLRPSAPLEGTGGFFADTDISVSVGRTGGAGTATDETATDETRVWPAEAMVTDRTLPAEQTEISGSWSCGA